MSRVESRLKEMGIDLPEAAAPIANYVPSVLTGSLLVISGQLCFGPDGQLSPRHTGKVGAEVSAEAATEAARFAAINLLAQAKAALGDLDRIIRCVRLGGFINCTGDYPALPVIMNGASNLMVEALGDRGRHARSTVGMAQLPLSAVVEIEAMFEVKA